jgi:ubiquinone/menaquinone biosynthesis C-methylase UbiE
MMGGEQAMESAGERVQKIFGERAAFYATSASHRDKQVLARVVEMANPEPHWTALDLATGTGHTAFAIAPYVRSVIGIDLTPQMLAEAEQLRAAQALSNVVFQIADVHDLPYEDSTFNLVTCRRAAHHFSDIRRALNEIRRVLKAGGRVVIDDRSVPEDDFVDRCMNLLDTYHDESHIREYRRSEWQTMLGQAGLSVDAVEFYVAHRPLTALTDGASEENVKKIRKALDNLTGPQRQAFNLIEKDGQLYLNHWFVMLSATT